MSQAFVGEIRMFGGSFAPANWAFCNGQTIAIDQNPALFQLIGTTYGGDGQTTFNLPNLQSRVPVHQGTGPGLSSYAIGENLGVEDVTLTVNQIPSHTHAVQANPATGDQPGPGGNLLAGGGASSRYIAATPATAMGAGSAGAAGNSLPHDNLQPLLAVSFIIALFGIFPSRN